MIHAVEDFKDNEDPISVAGLWDDVVRHRHNPL